MRNNSVYKIGGRSLDGFSSLKDRSVTLLDEANKNLKDKGFIYEHLKSWLDGIITDPTTSNQKQLDLSNTVVLVVGTWGDTVSKTRRFLQYLPTFTSAPDVATRMPERYWLGLPDSRDPFERIDPRGLLLAPKQL